MNQQYCDIDTVQEDFGQKMAHLSQENTCLTQQISQLQEENEQLLKTLMDQNRLEETNQELQAKMAQVQDEYENSQKALEYYQSELIPELKKTVERLQFELT